MQQVWVIKDRDGNVQVSEARVLSVLREREKWTAGGKLVNHKVQSRRTGSTYIDYE